MDSTSNPGLVPGDNWNNVSTAVGTTRNLHDDSRDATPADVTVVSGRSWNGFGAGTTGNAGFNRMVSDGVFGSGAGDNDDQVGISFAQIPYAIYDVYVFTQSRTTNGSTLSITLGNTTYYYTTDGHSLANEMKQITSRTSEAPTKGGSYALFRNVSGDSFVIKTGGSRTGVISNQIFGVHVVDSSDIPLASRHPPITTTAFFLQYCLKCHGPQKHKGDVRLDQIGSGVTGDNHKLWENVVHNIQRGEMPPEDGTQPSRRHRQAFLKQALSMLERHNDDNQTGKDPLLRLTNQQIAHSLQDLLGTATHIADRLIRDPVDKHGFSMQNDLDLSGSHLLLYADLLDEMLQGVFPDNL
ncbi:MAG: c-type cytochrome domain-containing protein, partial [Fuerstiella sp.]